MRIANQQRREKGREGGEKEIKKEETRGRQARTSLFREKEGSEGGGRERERGEGEGEEDRKKETYGKRRQRGNKGTE